MKKHIHKFVEVFMEDIEGEKKYGLPRGVLPTWEEVCVGCGKTKKEILVRKDE